MNKTLICLDTRPARSKYERDKDGATYYHAEDRRAFDVFVNVKQSRSLIDTILHEFMHVALAICNKKVPHEDKRILAAVDAALSILLGSNKRRTPRG